MNATACQLTDVYLSPISAHSAGAIPVPSEQIDRIDEAVEKSRSCAKGIIVAMSLEVGACLLLFAAWQAWHLIR
jgi:hypothetical protein